MKQSLKYFNGKLGEVFPPFTVIMCLTLYSPSVLAQDIATPTEFHAVQVGYTLELHWTDNAENETTYSLFKEWDDYYSLSETITLPANTELYIDTNVKPNISYRYSLWAENESGFSNEASLVGIVSVETPPAPGNVSAIAGPLMSIAVTFTDNSDMESYYEIHHTSIPDDFYGVNQVNGGELDGVITRYISVPPYNVYSPPLPDELFYFANTLVYIKVRAVINDAGTLIYGPFSPIVTALTNPEPAVATDFVANIEGNNVHLTWTDNSISEAAYFLAKFDGEFTGDFTLIQLPPDVTEYTDADIDILPNVDHQYWLIAIDNVEYTAWPPEHWRELFYRDERVAKTLVNILELPAVPTNVTATAISPTAILVTFVDNSDLEFWYELRVSLSADDSTGALMESSGYGLGSVVEMELQDLTPGTTYFFRVRGVMELNNMVMYGRFSEVISATTPSLIPDPPFAESASSLTTKSFVANWQPVEGATHYELDVFENKDSTFVPGYEGKIVYDNYATVFIRKKSAQHYSYLVRTVNEYGQESENSNIVAVAEVKNASFMQGETLGQQDLSGIFISQYPNPVVDKFQVLVSAHHESTAELQIINQYGSRILNQTIPTNVYAEIDATTYPAGMYILRAVVGKSARMVKVIKR